jgi:hypothetical protein
MSTALLDRQVEVLGWRADGRPVVWIRGGAEGDGGGAGSGAAEGGGQGGGAAGAGTAEAGAGSGNAGGGAAGQQGGDGSEEIEYNEDNFKRLVDELNKERAERAAAEERHQKEKHALSQEAKTYRLRSRALAAELADDATGKPGPKPKGAGAANTATDENDAKLTELSQQLEAARRGSLLSGARAALAEAGVPKSAIARAVRMVDLAALQMDDAGEITGLDEQITALREDVPQLFTPVAAAAPNGAGNGTGTGARVLRAAPAVAGKGAAGRGTGAAPEAPKSANILADRLLGKSEA